MKNTGLGILTLIFLSLFAVSCAQREGAGPESTQIIGDVLKYDLSVPVNAGRPISLTFWTQVDQEGIYRDLIKDYSSIHPNVRIELVAYDYNDYFNNLGIALQSGVGPDMFHMHNSFEDKFFNYIQPYPESIFPLNALEKDFRQVDLHLVNGKLPFIDTGLMTSAIFYNLDYWKAAGLGDKDIPKTWEDLRTVAKKLTVRDKNGDVTRSGFNPNGIAFSIFTAINLQRGQKLFEGDKNHQPIVDSQISNSTMRFIKSFYDSDRVASLKMAEFHESFGTGDAAMIYGWGWTNAWLERNFPGLHYGVFPTPQWSSDSPVVYDRNNGESSMSVNKNASEDKRAVAFDVIKYFLASDKYLVNISLQFDIAPSKRSLDSNPVLRADKMLSADTSILDKTMWPGTLPDFYEQILTDELIDPVILNGKEIGGALRHAQVKLEQAYEEDSAKALN